MGIPALAAESAQVVPSRRRKLHDICPCKATGVIESTLMLGGDASHRFLSFVSFFPSHKPSLSKARREYSMQRAGHRTRSLFYK